MGKKAGNTMKAEFDEKGALVIKAEDNTEVVALSYWLENFHQGDENSTLSVDTEWFRLSLASATGLEPVFAPYRTDQ